VHEYGALDAEQLEAARDPSVRKIYLGSGTAQREG